MKPLSPAVIVEPTKADDTLIAEVCVCVPDYIYTENEHFGHVFQVSLSNDCFALIWSQIIMSRIYMLENFSTFSMYVCIIGFLHL